jgi:hypothetical protein
MSTATAEQAALSSTSRPKPDAVTTSRIRRGQPLSAVASTASQPARQASTPAKDVLWLEVKIYGSGTGGCGPGPASCASNFPVRSRRSCVLPMVRKDWKYRFLALRASSSSMVPKLPSIHTLDNQPSRLAHGAIRFCVKSSPSRGGFYGAGRKLPKVGRKARALRGRIEAQSITQNTHANVAPGARPIRN